MLKHEEQDEKIITDVASYSMRNDHQKPQETNKKQTNTTQEEESKKTQDGFQED